MKTIKEKVLSRMNGRYVGNLLKAPNVYWIKMGIDETLEHVLKLMKEIEDKYALCGGAWNELKARIEG